MEEELDTNGEKDNKQEGIRVDNEKTYKLFGKVIKVAPAKDIKDITGKDKIDPEDVALVVQANGKEEEEKDKEKSKFKAKYLIPLLAVPIIIAGMAKSCTKSEQPVVEYDRIPVSGIVYNLDDPDITAHNAKGEEGQEGMTANGMEGNSYNGKYYSWQEQAETEEKTSKGSIEFQEMKQQIEANMDILTGESSTQEQRYNAAKNLLELCKQAENKYKENQSIVENARQKFEEASKAYEDSNTDNEILLMDNMVKQYLNELGLSSANVEQLQEIVDLCEQGYELNIESERELDGDYEITGEAIKEVVKQQDINKSKSVWQKFADFVKGRSDKGIEK